MKTVRKVNAYTLPTKCISPLLGEMNRENWQSSGLEQKGGSWVNFSEGGVGGDQRDPPRDRKMGTLWIRTEMWPICAYERMHVWLWPPTGMKLSEAKPPALYALSPRFFSGSIPAWRNTRTCRASSLSYVRLCFITCPGLDNGSILLFFLFFYSQASVFFPLFFNLLDELILDNESYLWEDSSWFQRGSKTSWLSHVPTPLMHVLTEFLYSFKSPHVMQ